MTARVGLDRAVLTPASPVHLFDGVPPEVAEVVLATLPSRTFQPGESVLREGELNRSVLLVESGQVAVWKGDPDTAAGVRLRTLHPGDCAGEISSLTYARVTTTLVALTPVTVREISPESIADPDVRERVMGNIARSLAFRLTDLTDNVLARHEEQIGTLRVQISAATFAARTLVLLSIYTFSLPVFPLVKRYLPSTAFFSFFIILMFTGVSWAFLKRSSTGLADYGFTLADWRGQIWRGLRWTLPLVGIATLLKLAVVAWRPETFSLFEPGRSSDVGHFLVSEWVFYTSTYVLLSFAQELVRCAIQGSLAIYYRSSRTPDRWRSLLVANIAFAATHVHLGLVFPLIAVVPGLFWGWLYQRERSFLAVAVSHSLLGAWVLFGLGVPY